MDRMTLAEKLGQLTMTASGYAVTGPVIAGDSTQSIIDGSIGYQLEVANAAPATGPDAVVQWDIRLGAEVFVPWGARACRAAGVFCD